MHAKNGKSDLEHPGIITPFVLLMEISKDRVILWLVSRFVALLQEALCKHTNIHVHTYILWPESFLLKLIIYVTDWLDPKSHVHILINKFLPVTLISLSLISHQTYSFFG